MRTTIDVPDQLLHTARELAHTMGGTIRELIIEGLETVISQRSTARSHAFSLPDRSVGGQGLQPEVGDLHWDAIRHLVYGGDSVSRP